LVAGSDGSVRFFIASKMKAARSANIERGPCDHRNMGAGGFGSFW
jgi:hypothetical protein